MAEPVLYIAGDVHDDGGGTAFTAFLDRLRERTPGRLVILGDLVEYWIETDACVRRHGDLLGRLKNLRQSGWSIDLVRGNREIVAGRRLETACGARLVWPALDVQLGPRRVRIVHGDRLCQDPSYRLYSAFMRGFWMRAIQGLPPAPIQDAVARALRARSQAGHRKPARQRIFIDPRRVVAAARGCDTLVAGHIHEAWRRRIRDVDLMLVGDWPPGGGRWIEGSADGTLRPATLG